MSGFVIGGVLITMMTVAAGCLRAVDRSREGY